MNDALIRKLYGRISLLEEELRQLREDIVPVDGMFASFLSRQEAIVLRGVYSRKVASFAYLDQLTVDSCKFHRYDNDVHAHLRCKVAICKIRRRLKPYGIEIKTWRGVGYYLDDENKAKLQALMEKK